MSSPGVLWDDNSSRRIEETIVNFQIFQARDRWGLRKVKMDEVLGGN